MNEGTADEPIKLKTTCYSRVNIHKDIIPIPLSICDVNSILINQILDHVSQRYEVCASCLRHNCGDVLSKIQTGSLPTSPVPVSVTTTKLTNIIFEWSEGFRETLRVSGFQSSVGDDQTSSRNEFNLLIEVLPHNDEYVRELVTTHHMFVKEIAVHENILPLLKQFVASRFSSYSKAYDGGIPQSGICSVDVNFFVPNYVYGDFDHDNGRGFIVLDDYFSRNYSLNSNI